MNNYTPFSPSGQSVDFTIGASTIGGVFYAEDFQTEQGGDVVYLRIRELNSTVNLKPGELQQGVLYEIAAFDEPSYETPQAISTWEGSNVNYIEAYTFTVDKRPLYVSGYATQTTDVDPRVASTSGKICGVTNTATKPYRKTPLSYASDSDFLDEEQNGRIHWVNDQVKPAIDQGFERVQFINCGGHTNFNGTQLNVERNKPGVDLGNQTPYKAMQPHYPSLVAGSMELDEYVYIIDSDTINNAVRAPTPFTPSGQPDDLDGRGDSTKAWRSAVSYTKSLGAKEVTSYQGYRSVFTDVNMNTPLTTITSLSAQSSAKTPNPDKKDRWSGEGNSPGFCPEPGFDGVGGSALVDRTKIFWDDEIRGILNMGFNGIGLDTGTRVYDNSGGRSNGDNSLLGDFDEPDAPNGVDGNLDLITYFNSFGIKPVFEAVGLNTWTAGGLANAGPDTTNDGARYKNSAYWAFFGSWWGYLGEVEMIDTNGNISMTTLTDDSFSTDASTPSGGRIFRDSADGATYVGSNPSTRGKMPAESEVHVMVQWKGDHLNALLEGTGSDLNGKKLTWIGLKQMLYDFHDAGIIVSASGHPTDPVEGITASEFRQYVLDLSNGLITRRPASDVKVAEMTAPGGLELGIFRAGQKGWDLSDNKSWDTSGDLRGTIEDNSGDFTTISLPALTNTTYFKIASRYYIDPTTSESAANCLAIQMAADSSGIDFYGLEKKVFMKITVDDGGGSVYTATLDTWGDTNAGNTAVMNLDPPSVPNLPSLSWADFISTSGWSTGNQPSSSNSDYNPWNNGSSAVTIELWQEG